MEIFSMFARLTWYAIPARLSESWFKKCLALPAFGHKFVKDIRVPMSNSVRLSPPWTRDGSAGILIAWERRAFAEKRAGMSLSVIP